jgi:signal peptidase I
MAKRVIAVAGDTVQLIKNKLYVNGQELTISTVVNTFVEDKRFLKQKHFNYLAFREKNIDGIEYDVVYASGFTDEYLEQVIVDTRAFTVPKEKVFVIGDNRNLSIDSRYFGAISTKNISAKVIYIAFNYKEIWLYITGKLNRLRLWKSMG